MKSLTTEVFENMSTQNSTVAISAALAMAVAEQHAQRAIPLRAALWANSRRREGKNDPQFTGTIEVDVLAIGPHIAEAIKNGEPKIVFFFDAWQNTPGESKSGGELPLISGKARNVRGPRTVEQAASERVDTETGEIVPGDAAMGPEGEVATG
jgi:hypothetical protein